MSIQGQLFSASFFGPCAHIMFFHQTVATHCFWVWSHIASSCQSKQLFIVRGKFELEAFLRRLFSPLLSLSFGFPLQPFSLQLFSLPSLLFQCLNFGFSCNHFRSFFKLFRIKFIKQYSFSFLVLSTFFIQMLASFFGALLKTVESQVMMVLNYLSDLEFKQLLSFSYHCLIRNSLSCFKDGFQFRLGFACLLSLLG